MPSASDRSASKLNKQCPRPLSLSGRFMASKFPAAMPQIGQEPPAEVVVQFEQTRSCPPSLNGRFPASAFPMALPRRGQFRPFMKIRLRPFERPQLSKKRPNGRPLARRDASFHLSIIETNGESFPSLSLISIVSALRRTRRLKCLRPLRSLHNSQQGK